MRRFASFGFVALAFVLFTAASPSRGASDDASHSAHGIVKGLDAKAGTVTIDHEDIPGVMMGMTMTFAVADRELLQGVAIGQTVDFSVRKDGSRFVVTAIKGAEQGSRAPTHGTMSGGGQDTMGMKQP